MNFYNKLEYEWEKEECNFDGFCRAVLRNEARDCYRELERQARKEVMFCEMSKRELNSLLIEDSYSIDGATFQVLGYDIWVEGDILVEAILSLPEVRQKIILLAYFMDMSDKEIAQCLDMPKRTVNYGKNMALSQMKKFMEVRRGERKGKERKLH
ncbi:sigma-70 family RNA polymerase sigma factor [Lachnospiraceae bacterium OttesenSCG-928-D06]|nr:sigma-70 family RNA polymerase sigma factor [Lachnospiraceae bacterium OttesenSCG-928-D06]